MQALTALPGVTVTGRVPDVRPYLAHAAAAVAPMRIARGIQNKVLEAMAMARPVVVTPDALEGIAAQPGTEVLVAADAAAFAAAPKGFDQVIGHEDLSFDGEKEKKGRFNILIVSPEMGAKLLGTTPAGLDKYRQSVAKAGKAVSSSFKPVANATAQASLHTEPFTTENVLGYLEGSDKKEEVIVVSAHYDHLGIKNGVVFNGADDDGSGTVSVLAMARAFTQAKKEGHGPRRSLLFLSVTGEEKGLFGSEYYSKNPVFPLASTEADLNVDMIGRTDVEHEGKPDYVYVIGSDKLASELKVINQAQNKKYTQLDLDYRFDDPADPNRFYYRSDHYNFAVNKIPVAFFFNGVHADYHQQSDEIEKIEFAKMEKRARLVFHLAWELANRDGRVVVDSNKP